MGFSLIELMIALVVIGILSSVILPVWRQQQERQKVQVTLLHQERIFYALAAFLQTHGRLPCPSDPGNLRNFGQERLRCQRPEYMQGVVPFKTLGLSENMAKNGNQDFFTYSVHPQLTITRTFQEYCQEDLQPVLTLSREDASLDARFDPIAVLLISPHNKKEASSLGPRSSSMGFPPTFPVIERWETRKNLASFYGRLFCRESPLSFSPEN